MFFSKAKKKVLLKEGTSWWKADCGEKQTKTKYESSPYMFCFVNMY